MSETPHEGQEEIVGEDGLTDHQREQMESAFNLHPEYIAAAEGVERRDCTEEVKEFKEKVEAFKSTYSLEELLAITHLTEEEVDSHPIWQPAIKAIALIEPKLKALKNETTISAEELAEVTGMYKQISQAIGLRHAFTGVVSHDRE